MNQIIIIGRMDNTQDGTLEIENRVYSADGVSPTLSCSGGGKLLVEFNEDQGEQRTRIL